MNYFVNENIFALNSGTEFSAVKRHKLFKKNGVPSKILTRNYNTNLSTDLKNMGLDHSDILCMYDYFQETTEVPAVELDTRYTEVIDKRKYHIEGQTPNESWITYRGDRVAQVNIAPATVGLVGNIEYYNVNQTIVSRDFFDRRGFKSSTQFYHPDGSEGLQVFFDFDGQPKIEIARMNINGVLSPTMYKLLDYKGKAHRFDSENDLFVFFLNELAAAEPSVFINDRPTLTKAVSEIQGAVGKWEVLHGAHSSNNNQAGASRHVVDYLKPLFKEYYRSLDGVLTGTAEEADEIRKVFKFHSVLSVPDTYAEEKTFSLDKRDKNQILVLGRLSADKKSVDPINILQNLHQSLPEAKIVFYGYATPETVKAQIDEQIAALNLKDFVEFKGYQRGEELQKAFETSAVLLNTAESEAFGMNILEALNEGIPVVSYDVKYGPKHLIESGKNGELVPYGAVDKAAAALVRIMKDPSGYATYAKAAFEKAQEFSESKMWEKWLEQQAAVENLFIK